MEDPLSRERQGGGVFSPCDGPSQPLYTGTPQYFFKGVPNTCPRTTPGSAVLLSPCRTLNAELGVP